MSMRLGPRNAVANGVLVHARDCTRHRRRWLRTLGVALTLATPWATGCGSDGAPVDPATVTLPPYPFAETQSIVVDESAIAAEGGTYCRDARAAATAVEFYLGTLPLTSIDALCSDAPAYPGAQSRLGSLYVSGYFGGVWLRDSLMASGARERARTKAPGTTGLGEIVFTALSNLADDRLALARQGEDEALIDSARATLPLLLTLFGYNLGYLEVAAENPPPGVPTSPSAITCDGFLDCRGTAVDLATLDRYRSALRAITAPPSDAWAEVAGLVERFGEGSVSAGRGVWEDILGGSSIAPSAYGPLLDLSAGYLLVSEAAVLANATAFAEADAGAARCGALVETGLVIWSGSYFEGLASSAAPGTFPTLACPS